MVKIYYVQSMDDEKKLISLAQNGDEQAFELLYRKYITLVYGYVFHKVGRKEEAEDLTSEIWMATLKNLTTYTAHASFKNWIFGIVKHKIMDYYQEKYKIEKVPLIEEIFQAEDNEEDEEDQSKKEQKLNRILAMLPENYKQVLFLRFLKGYTTAEIAKELGLTISNVKVIQYRAIKKAEEIKIN